MKRIEFGETRIGDIARGHINDCLDNNWVSMGPKVELFEQKFAELMGCKYAVAVSSGTAALTCMTLALPEIAKRNVQRGKSNVICPALTFISNNTAIVSGGLIPRPVDISPYDLNIDPDKVYEAIDKDTVAIYTVGTMGCPSKLDKLKEIADHHDLILFADECESYGSLYNEKPAHEYAIGSCASFYQAHMVQAGGEMGALYTNNERLKDLVVSIRSHGRNGKSAYFDHVRFGSNFKTTDLAAAVGLEGIEEFHDNMRERKAIWQSLVDFCAPYRELAWFSIEPPNTLTMPHGFSITLKRNHLRVYNLQQVFDDSNIHWKRNFGATYSHSALSEYKYVDCPNAEWVGNNGIHCGCHRFFSKDDVDRVCMSIREFFE